MKKTAFLCIAILLVASLGSLQAQDNVNTKSISVFKNGIGYFIKEMKVNVADGKYIFENLPIRTGAESQAGQPAYNYSYAEQNPVIFGTIWFAADGNTIKSVNAYDKKIQKSRLILTMKELIESNVGKTADIKLSYQDKSFKAKILKVESDVVVFEKESKFMAVNVAWITDIEMSEKPEMNYKTEESNKAIELTFAKSASGQPVSVMYLQKGITWAPNYLIELLDDSKARISLRASLLNDIEDIENTDLNFVVGVPSFKYANVESPLLSKTNVAGFLSALSGYSGSTDYYNRNMMNAPAMAQSYDYSPPPSPAESYNVSMDNASNEELYLYRMKGVTLKKGGRALYSVAQINTDYENLYSVELPSNYNVYTSTLQQDRKNDVWRSIKFKNESKIPFTTGTAYITKLNSGISEPLSQNELKYTPVNGSNEVKMTIAPDVLVTDSEKEIDRVEKAKQFTYWNDLITMEGKVEIKNYKDKKIKLKIHRMIDGELANSSDKWDSQSILNYSDARNKKNDVNWEIEVKSGETKTITYSYKIFIQR
jgi:hypothetical protein